MTDQLKSGERLPDVTVTRPGGGDLWLGEPADARAGKIAAD